MSEDVSIFVVLTQSVVYKIGGGGGPGLPSAIRVDYFCTGVRLRREA